MNSYNSDNVESQIDNLINITTQNITTSNSSYNNSDDNANNSVPDNSTQLDEQSIEVFNNALHQYLQIDEEVKTLLQAIKSRNEKKKKLGEMLELYLKTNNIKNVNLDGSYKGKKLENIITYTKTGFTRGIVAEAIHDELKEDAELFDKVMNAISSKTVMKEFCKLKITQEKVANGKNTKAKTILDDAELLLNG
jgi:hypothetical protein